MCLINGHLGRKNKELCQFLSTSYPYMVLASIKNASVLFGLSSRGQGGIRWPHLIPGWLCLSFFWSKTWHWPPAWQKDKPIPPRPFILASAWGGKVGDAWSTGKGPVELVWLLQAQGLNPRAEGEPVWLQLGCLQISSCWVFLVFITLALKKKSF